ncbi:MAG: hypothetical protein V3R25_09480 [Nitrosomonadaceae bacterium]
MSASGVISMPQSDTPKKSSGSGKRGTKRQREEHRSLSDDDDKSGDPDDVDDSDKRGGGRAGSGRRKVTEEAVPVSHDLARQSVCIGCLRNFGEKKRQQQGQAAHRLSEETPLLLKLCELLGADFVYRSYDRRLPTYLCGSCSTYVLRANDRDTISVFERTAAQRQQLTQRAGIAGFVRFRCPGAVACPLCQLATKVRFGRVEAESRPAEEPTTVIGMTVVNGLRHQFGISQNKSLRICRFFAERFNIPTASYLRRDVSASNLQLADAFEIGTRSTRDDDVGTVIHAIDAQAYVDRLINDRGMNAARTVVMLGCDKGDNTVKVSATLLELDDTGVPCSVPIAGFKSSGVQAIQILAIAVADETYDVVDELMSSVQLKQRTFLCLDHKTKLTMTGISGGSPIHQCDVCYWDKRSGDDEKHEQWNDVPRTFADNRAYHNAWVAAGSQKKRAQEFMNCTKMPIHIFDNIDGPIADIVVLSGLHLTINIVSRLAIHGSEKLKSSNAECREVMSAWLTADLYVKKHHGRDAWEGNKCITMCSPRAIEKLRTRITDQPHSIAERMMGVVADERRVHKASLYADALEAFHFVRTATFGDTVHDDAAQRIAAFRDAYLALNIDVSRTVHVVLRHLLPFCRRWRCGLLHFIEQTHESVHRAFRLQLALQYRANVGHPDAARFLLQALLIFNGLRRLNVREDSGYDDADGRGDGGDGTDGGGSASEDSGADDSKHDRIDNASRDDTDDADDDRQAGGSGTNDRHCSTSQSQVCECICLSVYVCH